MAMDNVKGPKTQRKERETNIELLRVLCMFGIVAHHAVVHGGGLSLTWGGKAIFASLIVPAGKIGFTCFLAISMWFLCDSAFKGKRFIATWLEVLFYTVIMTAVAAFCGTPVTTGEWIGSFMPIGGISHGFAATYLVVYLLLPLLARVSEGMTRSQVFWVVVLLAYCQILEGILGIFGVTIPSLHPFSSEIILFVLFFFMLLYLKKWPIAVTSSKIALLAIVAFVWAICTFSVAAPIAMPGSELAQSALLISAINPGENGIFNTVGGMALFFLFKQLKVPHSKLINRIASCTFGVLLFHDHNVCRPAFWSQIIPGGMAAIWALPGLTAMVGVILVSIAIFAVGCAFDLLRQIIQKGLAQTDSYAKVCTCIDRVWSHEA